MIAGWVVAAALSAFIADHAQAETAAPESGPTPEAAATSSAEDEASSRCEEIVAVLSGKKKDDALLDDPKVREVAARSFDLVVCRAVVTDSDAPCALVPDQEGECRHLRSILHELRVNPQGRSFTFPDVKYELCRADPKLKPVCDRLREAARSGDPKECAGTGDQESTCRATLALDKSLCTKAEDPDGCIKAVDASLVFAKGLQALAESGPPREQALAKAALGDADACESFARAAVGSCPGPTAGPTSTAAKTPASTAAPAPSPVRDAPQ